MEGALFQRSRHVRPSSQACRGTQFPGLSTLTLTVAVCCAEFVKQCTKGPEMSWEARAACRGDVAALFFAPDGECRPERELREEAAKAICAACPVRRECLSCALSADIRDGIWGGLTEDERRGMRRNRARRRRVA